MSNAMNGSARFEHARKIADAVLYEGYLLYPYRASSSKNQIRWQFGVLTPPAWSDLGSGEPSASQTECIIEPSDNAILHVKVRFLQVRARIMERAVDTSGEAFTEVPSLTVDGETLLTWDAAEEREVDVTLPLAAIIDTGRAIPFEMPGSRTTEPLHDRSGTLAGQTVHQQWPISGLLRLSAEALDGPYGVARLRLRIENVTPAAAHEVTREDALRQSLVAAHALLSLDDGTFISLLEYPEWAKHAAVSCENLHTFPVLVGEDGRRDLMLSSPLILYDYPKIAPESGGDLFDATEIDEILLLRTMTMTDDEKREARATDHRAGAIVDRADAMPAEMMDRLHGAVRYLREVTGESTPEAEPERLPWWDPGVDTSVSPDTDSVEIEGVDVARGSTVRLRPGARRADAQDMFLIGRIATVEAVLTDLEDMQYLAVTLQDDPGADLQKAHGRFLYFSPEEVEPLGESP
jgi:hypothetical protein